ncbi:ANTAR domain-containing protein [Kineococcus sp. T13]|uniref:ANTAR domain-containing protein n=1 Tax=Kineococcus vitellinus TaxID=2696565 RepID=UPI0014125B16|nr:ANTAR domain-containing protein [Kineococcus vitellinus]NAZ74829.1 ANTAR domain-containing protein [Kineococcus vitellinus]
MQHATRAAQDQDELETLRTEVAQLRTALSRRPVIDMAKGAIMAIMHCDEDTAFRQLSAVSQQHNVKLHTLAGALLGDLTRAPGAPGAPAPRAEAVSEADRLVQRHWTRR